MIRGEFVTTKKVLVVGGANVDIKGRASGPLTQGTSNPGLVWKSPGGVGRNIATNLAVIGTSVAFVTAFGQDEEGEWLRLGLMQAGVDTSRCALLPSSRTSTYLAIVDERGELSVAVSAMQIMDALTPSRLREALQGMDDVAIICLDTNLPTESLDFVTSLAKDWGIPVVSEPVSVMKAKRLHQLLPRLYAVTPNQDELAALAGMEISSTRDVYRAATRLVERGVKVVVTTRGAKGAVVTTVDGSFEVEAMSIQPVDVTGAGDAFTAGFAAGLVRGLSPFEAAGYGNSLAARVVCSEQSVLTTEER